MSLQDQLDDAHVELARRPEGLRGGVDVKPLPPRLWESLRLLLQTEYRRATGEETATLRVELTPPEPGWNDRTAAVDNDSVRGREGE